MDDAVLVGASEPSCRGLSLLRVSFDSRSVVEVTLSFCRSTRIRSGIDLRV
jgi:hypothetical protein